MELEDPELLEMRRKALESLMRKREEEKRSGEQGQIYVLPINANLLDKGEALALNFRPQFY